MRRILVLASTLLVALTTTPSASAESPHTVTFTINCGAAGTFTGSQPGGAGGALLLGSGGVAVNHGLAEVGGELLIQPTPGLE